MPISFLCDGMLGDITRWLRLLGLDAAYAGNTASDGEILDRLVSSNRTLVTRDEQLHARAVAKGQGSILLPNLELVHEVAFILRMAGVEIDDTTWFSRCTTCGALLENVAAGDVRRTVPPAVLGRFQTFRRCPSCGQVYWEGTHAEPIRTTLAAIKKALFSSNKGHI